MRARSGENIYRAGASDSMLRRDKDKDERVIERDFFSEHERFKMPAAPPQPSQPAQLVHAAPTPAARPPIEVLIEALRTLGIDVKPFEALGDYARQLEEKERELTAKIQELQRALDAIRAARKVLRDLGV